MRFSREREVRCSKGEWKGREGKGREGKGKEGGILTTAEPVVVHFARIAFDVVVLGGAFGDFENLARDHDVGSVSATGPFLAVGAVAEAGDHGFAGVFVLHG